MKNKICSKSHFSLSNCPLHIYMLFVRPRIIIKCTIFLAMLGFLVFFVVYGYRYDGDTRAFVPHTASYHVATRADDSSMRFDGYEQTTYEDSIDVYNIRPGCYDITKGNQSETTCFDDYAYIWDTHVSVSDIQTYDDTPCTPIQISLDASTSRCLEDTCFWSNIISNFLIKKIGFIQTKKSIYTCDSTFLGCKKLIDISSPVVCYSDIWLHTATSTIVLE